ncbi:DUF3592 domain-containing protein [Streptomyces sp. NPDC048603]|uniref:DUF3592 domain-containing protein n=1 Tax=Streptomyces sp. NPDC048603 TaxID=3365577 RepID=UPI003711CA06
MIGTALMSSLVPWILALVLTASGAAIGTAAYIRARRTQRLLRTGTTARGVVSRLKTSRMSGMDSDATIVFRSTGTTVYAPVIAWTTAGDRRMETESSIARTKDKTPAPGTRVEVLYDPANPDHWILAGESPKLWWFGAALGALFTMAGLGLLVGALFTQVL